MSVDVSVIIVSYNARKLLGKCLQAVAAASQGPLSVEVIVVDNDSSDDSVAYVQQEWPDVRVIDTGHNGGMAAGNNVGMLAASGRYLYLLNSDAFLEPDSLGALVEDLDAHPDAAMAVPRLLNEDGSLQRSARGFPSVWRLATEFLYIRKLAPHSRALNSFYAPGFSHDESGDSVDWYMGAAMLVRRAAVDEIGLMDEVFFMYGEEVDWQQRMRAGGWGIRFVAESQVVHLGGGSSRTAWGRMYESQIRNHIRYLALHNGIRSARRARRMIRCALLGRSLLYRAASLIPGGGRSVRRERAALFAAARRSLRDLDVPAMAHDRRIPAWPSPAPS